MTTITVQELLKITSVISTLTYVLESTWSDGSEYGFKWIDDDGDEVIHYDYKSNTITVYENLNNPNKLLPQLRSLAISGLCAQEKIQQKIEIV